MGDVTTVTATAPAQRRRPELAAFLRSRRARVTPADVGMPPGLRRRTPGLRREEVAQLSGVGVTWYTWLEQGRPINASAQVLDAVARTLRLDRAEREHLFQLAEVPFLPEQREAADALGPEVQGILDALAPRPAVVYNARYDVLATNSGYRSLFPMVALLPPSERNSLYQLFTVPCCCCPVLNLDEELPIMVGQLRAAYGRHVGDPVWEGFIARLSAASEDFATMWARGDVIPPGRRVKVFQHFDTGTIRMTSLSLEINGMPECRIVVYTPNDPVSAERLDRLMALDDPHFGCTHHSRRVSEWWPGTRASEER